MTPLAAGTSFDVPLLVFGAVLMGGALLSGVAHRSFLSLTALFVLAGFILGEGGLEVLEFDPGSGFVAVLATVALVVILFRDGLEVEAEMLQREWRLPFRKLVIAMPITAAVVALAAHELTGLGWTESFLLGSILAPTDPVLSSSVVTNPRVPRLVRHSLNLESGLNDGLALPAVLAFSAALRVGDDGFTWWQFVLQDITLGFAYGIALGFAAAALLPRARGLAAGIPDHQKSLYALGTAFATYGLAVLLPLEGNGLIAVFVCAITFGIRRPDLRATFEARADDIVEIAKLGVFVVFGSLLTLDGLFVDGWASVGLVLVTLLVARPVAVWIALLRTRLRADVIVFMAWFGPKGVATMTFSLLVLADDIPGNAEIFNLAALVVFTSILVHGLSDTPGSDWIAARVGPAGEVTRGAAPAPAR
jgi:NhaP-type Na+/H+ or K+/H+ antiporter